MREPQDSCVRLPDLTRDERRALLDRAVELTVFERGAPADWQDWRVFDMRVDLLFAMSEWALRQCLLDQAEQLEDQAILDGAP